MLIGAALSEARAITGTSLPDPTLVRWLGELDGRLAFEFYHADGWTPYDPVNDLGAELLIPFPWDGVYVTWLECMTYYSNGEYDRYENAVTVFNRQESDFRKHVTRLMDPPCMDAAKTGGSGVTVITAQDPGNVWMYLSAYAIAVKHGYAGTEAEFAAGLVNAANGGGSSGGGGTDIRVEGREDGHLYLVRRADSIDIDMIDRNGRLVLLRG